MLWRGPELDGSDVDILVVAGRTHEVARVLRAGGLSPAPQDDGRVMWRSFAGDGVVIDAMPAEAWPAHHPSLDGVLDRTEEAGAELPVASVADRLLIRAAEAVGGRPVDHVARKARPLVSEPDARAQLRAVAAREQSIALADLIEDPDALLAATGPGPLPLGRAARVAARSPLARAALRARIARVVGITPHVEPPAGARPGEGLIVALSGMDGSGKSTAALELVARLSERDRAAMVAWNRLGAESEVLDLIARPARALLRRRGRTAGEELTATTDEQPEQATEDASPATGPVAAVWVAIVALINARSHRRAARGRRAGVVVVCDRWLPDALVDLELRYGRHRVAEWILRRATPRADVAVLLDIDAATSIARKPGDQAEHVLARMATRYEEVARDLGFPPVGGRRAPAGQVRIDARGDATGVVAAIDAQVESAVAARDVSG